MAERVTGDLREQYKAEAQYIAQQLDACDEQERELRRRRQWLRDRQAKVNARLYSA